MFLRNGLEPWHLLLVGIVILLVFGSKKLPDTARALGKSMRILKSETKAMKGESGSASVASGSTAARQGTDAGPGPASESAGEPVGGTVHSAPGTQSEAAPGAAGSTEPR